ncbi:MAG: CBS domain-containing protein [Ideonella sp.]|nr:CBS domain-containing protein [Ideonella sp.]
MREPDAAPAFAFDVAPFDVLRPDERAQVRRDAVAVTLPAATVLYAGEERPRHCYLLTRGHVEEVQAGEVVAVHGADALIGALAVLTDRTSSTWTACGEVAAFAIPRALLQALIAGNASFGARLLGALSHGLAASAQHNQQREMLSLMMVRIADAYLRKPFFVDGAADLVTVCRELAAQGLTNALVRDGERLGMFTTTDLRDALLRESPPAAVAVREVAHFDLIEMRPEAELFDALLTMVRHRVHRVLVRAADGEILGVLTQLDLMSFVSNHSHIIALRIEQSASIAELREAALQMDGLVALLHGGGVRIEVLTALVSELNTRVFARLWGFVAPPELVANSCLVVMGSEGRGEQILKTDQDNALLLRDGFEFPALDAVAQRFNAALADFGYPPCSGGIMLTNPLWRQPLAGFRETLRDWVYGHDPEGVMHLAIFFDAVAVAGDAALLQSARQHLDAILAGGDAFLARFARAADQFAEPGHWWSRLTAARRDEQPIDLKKLGTFPIVHGVRALALQHHVRALATVQRIRSLVDARQIDADLARDLIDALHFLMGLKLKHQLRQRQFGETPGNLVLPSAMATMERDMLRDALAIIKRFRQHLAQHFRFDAL